MKKLTLLVLLLTPLFSFSQDCDCESNFNWTRKTFEENDAGFAYSIERKGALVYQEHNKLFLEKVKNITDIGECTQTLYEWLTFFRKGHIAIIPKNQNQKTSKPNKKKIIQQFKDSERLDVDLKNFTNYLSQKETQDYEGIWLSGSYEIGIKKVDNKYLGFIIKADGVYWTEGQIKLKINEDLSATYYMQDHSPKDFPTATMLGDNYLEMGFITLKRKDIKTISNEDKAIERYFTNIETKTPFFQKINDKTTLLRIPSFDHQQRELIDSVILAHKKEITNTPNLVIDLRNNGGGSDESYYKILPLIYTDTIRTIGLEFLSTPTNNQRMLDFIDKKDEYGFGDEEVIFFKEAYEKLAKNEGKFVNLDSTMVDFTSFDTIYPYPEKVGIIVNDGNGSTTEQFLLAAKQSEKVKLFGTKTFGALDISNMIFIPSPSGEFELGYCLSKSYRIPDMAIDDVGILPDYYINQTIPKYKWIDFVLDVLK